jgi:hypothetical protein
VVQPVGQPAQAVPAVLAKPLEALTGRLPCLVLELLFWRSAWASVLVSVLVSV